MTNNKTTLAIQRCEVVQDSLVEPSYEVELLSGMTYRVPISSALTLRKLVALLSQCEAGTKVTSTKRTSKAI